MRSIGLVFKKQEMTIVSLREGIRDVFFEGYRIVPFMDFKAEEKEAAILHNLERFLKAHKGGKHNLFIALPRDSVLLRFLHMPLAVEEDLGKTLGYEMDRHTPFAADEVFYDYHIVQRFPENNMILVLLVTIKQETLEYYLDLLKKIKLAPRGIEITSTALFNVFQKAHAQPERLPDLSWLKRQPYFLPVAKRFPKVAALIKEPARQENRPGVNVLVEQLEKAYELNVAYDKGLYFSTIVPAEAAGPDDSREEQYFHDLYSRAMKSLITLPYSEATDAGVGVTLSGKEMTAGYLEQVPDDIRPQFSIMNRFPITVDSEHEGSINSILPLLSVPIGLALKGLKSVPLDINLIPPGRRPRKKRSKKKIGAAAAAVLFACLFVAYFIHDTRETERRLGVLNKQLLTMKQKVQSIEALQAKVEKIELYSTTIDTIRKKKMSKLDILAALTDVLPVDSWLTDFEFKSGQGAVKVSGFSVSASKLIPLLEESDIFEDVKFTSPITMDKREKKEKFKIEMKLSTKKETK